MGETVLRLGRRGIGLQNYIRLARSSAWMLSGAALDLDFANARGYNSADLTKLTPDSVLTYTAPSPKWVYNAAGVLVQSSGKLPYDYDPVTHEPLGILVEEQRTNLLTYSEHFDNAVWIKANLLGVTANTGVSPDGNTNAERLTPAVPAGIHTAYRNSVTVVSGTTYALSLYAKADGYAYIALMYHNGASTAGNETIQLFNLAAGTVGASYNTAPTSATIEDVGGGWYRITITKSWATTSGNVTICPMNIDANPRASLFAGDATSGVLVWGAQLEAGAFATSYIPTVASQVTRAADQVSILTSAFAYNAAEGSVVTESDTNQMSGVSYSYIASFGDGTSSERIVSRSLNTDANFAVVDGGGVQAAFNLTGSIAQNVPFKFAYAYKANDFSTSLDGGGIGADASGTIPTVTTLKFGADSAATGTLNGHIKRLTYFPTRKPNAELQALAA